MGQLTVKAVVETLLLFQGVRLSAAGNGEAAVNEAAQRVVKAATAMSATAGGGAGAIGGGGGGGGHSATLRSASGKGGVWPLSAPSVAESLLLRQRVVAAEAQVATQAAQLAELGLSARTARQKLAEQVADFAAFKTEHSDAYRRALIEDLHAENRKLSISAAKWRAVAGQQSKEMAGLRQTNLALAGQATETRRVAYQICTGGRVNSNTSARIGVTAGAVHNSGRSTPATPGHKEFISGGGGGSGSPSRKANVSGTPADSCRFTTPPVAPIALRPNHAQAASRAKPPPTPPKSAHPDAAQLPAITGRPVRPQRDLSLHPLAPPPRRVVSR